MEKHFAAIFKKFGGVIFAVLLFSFGFSGWIYNYVRSENDKRALELATMSNGFVQQYGTAATIKQLIIPEKVYAALWEDSEKIQHVSWNIGGLWVEVWKNKEAIPTPAP